MKVCDFFFVFFVIHYRFICIFVGGMEIFPIAHFRSPMRSKFGIPRQSGLVSSLTGSIVFESDFRRMEALRGLDDFDYLWIIWEFSEGRWKKEDGRLMSRPPRLGGNKKIGVFATRSPFRPNNLGLSCVKIDHIEDDPALGPVIHVRGADLMDGTPIYDIKPYVAYADAHEGAKSGFVDKSEWKTLKVEIPEETASLFSDEDLRALMDLLALDPRPHYQNDEERVYGMPFGKYDVRFRVVKNVLKVTGCVVI